MKILYWLRSDLRLHDNPALHHFAANANHGIVMYCPSRSQRRAEDYRRSFIWASIWTLVGDLRALGAAVHVSERDIREILPSLLKEQKIERIVFSEDFGSEEFEDETWVRSLGLPCDKFYSRTLLRREDLPFELEALPEVFTQFRKKIEEELKVDSVLSPPSKLPGASVPMLDAGLSDHDLEAKITHRHPRIEAGERAGLKRLEDYIWTQDKLKVYKETRDGLLDWNDSSKLSPWLSVGALSARMIYAEIKRYEVERVKNESTYWLFFELLWRDYFHWIGLKWGVRLFSGMKRSTPRLGTEEVFESWKAGRSGQGFIDAHMRELAESGWMSNRGRQNVANYLVKTLDVDWRLGAAYFERKLIDYDASSNWGNWAYQAGTGQDPRNRRFDPEYQARLYDPEGLYQNLWSATK